MALALSLPSLESRPAHPPETRPARVQPWLDETLKRDFKTWLLDPSHLAEFDRGTVLIPKEFLAKAAIAPGSLASSLAKASR